MTARRLAHTTAFITTCLLVAAPGAAGAWGATDPYEWPAPVFTATPTPTPTSTATPTPTSTATPEPTSEPTAAEEPSDASGSGDDDATAPVLGKSVVLEAASGSVRVRVPGAKGFVALDDVTRVPSGAEIDARHGVVTLESALPGEETQSGTFHGGVFKVRQSRTGRGMIDLRLTGSELSRCRRATARSSGLAMMSGSKPKRRLWAKDKGGRFRTRGAHSVATARGTQWLTEDRCNGTLTRVTEGAVSVRSRGGRTVLVRAGKKLLVRGRAR